MRAMRAKRDIPTILPRIRRQGGRRVLPGEPGYEETIAQEARGTMEDRSKITPGEVVQVSALVRRVTAPNPGMMTGPGTNTYIVGTRRARADRSRTGETTRICRRSLAVVGDRLRWILCTHTHLDHSPGARALKAATGAEVIGMRAPQHGNQDTAFAPDRVFAHGDVLDCGEFTLRAVHTPGHASNHLCYLLDREKLLFTGDHVMQGSTVVINPPDGDMIAYLQSLESLLALDIVAHSARTRPPDR